MMYLRLSSLGSMVGLRISTEVIAGRSGRSGRRADPARERGVAEIRGSRSGYAENSSTP